MNILIKKSLYTCEISYRGLIPRPMIVICFPTVWQLFQTASRNLYHWEQWHQQWLVTALKTVRKSPHTEHTWTIRSCRRKYYLNFSRTSGKHTRHRAPSEGVSWLEKEWPLACGSANSQLPLAPRSSTEPSIPSHWSSIGGPLYRRTFISLTVTHFNSHMLLGMNVILSPVNLVIVT